MNTIDRRSFLKTSLLTTAALALTKQGRTAQPASASTPAGSASPIGLIDTNVNLFAWPFRKLKYSDTQALVAKLRRHRVMEAWAGSFEALVHKEMDGVNSRLAAECRANGGGILVPFGSVNLAWPDWEEDVRRCHEVYHMPGIRIYPGYQPFDLDHPGMEGLVKMTAERGLMLQVAFGMEDPRVHHPIITVSRASSAPLIKVLKDTPKARLALLHFSGSIRGEDLHELMTNKSDVVLDISALEGNGAVGRMIGAAPDGLPARVPVERIVFGSHAPYFPVETAILKLMESPLEANHLQAIMQGNARRLLPRA